MADAQLMTGDCRPLMAAMEAGSVDAIVTDPPYEYGFMGAAWDRSGVAFQPETWAGALRVVKPGTHLVAFGGPRTFHRVAAAIEDAGWELRDTLSWLYGQGMPKSLNIGKEIDRRGGVSIAWFGPWLRTERERRGMKMKELAVHFPSATGGLTGCVANWELGYNLPTPDQFNTLVRVLGLPFDSLEAAERAVVATKVDPGGRRVGIVGGAEAREFDVTAPATDLAKQWNGWGTALKPAWEPIILARAPLSSTVAENVMAHGTGALNVLGCSNGERWPANVILTHSPDCIHWQGATRCAPGCPVAMLDAQAPDVGAVAPVTGTEPSTPSPNGIFNPRGRVPGPFHDDAGGASRFMYVAKAPRSERDAGLPPDLVNDHPTVKPIDVMRWLVRLVTPPGGLVFDPFTGSGTTGCAVELEGGFRFLGSDLKAHHIAIAGHRMAYWRRMAAAARAQQAELQRVQPLDLFDCL